MKKRVKVALKMNSDMKVTISKASAIIKLALPRSKIAAIIALKAKLIFEIVVPP